MKINRRLLIGLSTMKKFMFFIVLFNFITLISAQQWAPIGTRWYYTDISWFNNPVIYKPRIIESIGDTTINGHQCRIIQGKCNCDFTSGKNYMYYENDKIFLFNDSLNQFHVLYDFTKTQGEIWNVLPPAHASQYGINIDSFTVIVDSVYTKIIMGKPYNIQHIRNYGSGMYSWEFYGELIKGIGNIFLCFFPPLSTCDPYTSNLRCYETPDTLIKFDSFPCDTVYTISSIDELKIHSKLSISPNPFTQSTQISLDKTYREIILEVYNVHGQLVSENHYTSCNQINFSRGRLVNGIYFLILILDNKTIETKKVLISD